MSRSALHFQTTKIPLKVVNINGKDDTIFVNPTSSIADARRSEVLFECPPLPNSLYKRYIIDRAQQSVKKLQSQYGRLPYTW